MAAYGQLWDVPDPEARPVLDELARRGYRLGVVSNSDGRVERGLERLGLREGLEVVVDSGVVGIEKPDPRIFEIALERLGVPAGEAVYVGDIPAIDLAGACAAGLSFVLVDPLGLWPDAIDAPRLRRLADLPDLLDALG
jgi:putative hydrolase of the HAD superfamily